jgi:type I restriction enzyme S subunit
LRFKPADRSVNNLKRVEKIDFSREIYLPDKPSNNNMILIKKGDLVIPGINIEKGALSVYQVRESVSAGMLCLLTKNQLKKQFFLPCS